MLSILLALPLLAFASPVEKRANGSITIPAECDVIPKYTLKNFHWFNSTHNLDCIKGPDVGDGTICLGPYADGSMHCGYNPCMVHEDVPPGYGPVDQVSFGIDGLYVSDCTQRMPSYPHQFEIGDGIVMCGNIVNTVDFRSDSNTENTFGTITFGTQNRYACTNGSTISPVGKGTFPITCKHDDGFNATCTAEPFVIPIVSYTIY
jgi:hypothetical protein